MDKYDYTYEKTSNYCYPDSDVLINLLGITDDKDLYNAERELVAYKTASLIQDSIQGDFDFEHLKAIHKRLFEKIYSWAGEPRNCNIAKQDLFCLAEHIDSYAIDIFDNIKRNNYFMGLEYNGKIASLANTFGDINALHPFREGNGRSQREFINELAKINGIKSHELKKRLKGIHKKYY